MCDEVEKGRGGVPVVSKTSSPLLASRTGRAGLQHPALPQSITSQSLRGFAVEFLPQLLDLGPSFEAVHLSQSPFFPVNPWFETTLTEAPLLHARYGASSLL